MAVEEQEKMEKTLIKLLDYQKEHNVNIQDLMTMMSLISLMTMIDVLNRDKPAGAATFDSNSLQAMLGPLLGLMVGGMGSGGGDAGKQPPFNPAMLFNLLSALGGGQSKGSQPKGGSPDLSGLMWLLAPLLGVQGGVFKPSPVQSDAASTSGSPPQPVQREINLDLKENKIKESKFKDNKPSTEIIKSVGDGEIREKLPKPGEVLEWKFGAS
ncbi:hypothetical protein [Desulfotruncus alcoholivorax]|uniref:hypothetical protein n=1 Tax=Desulfotruncus alcoholivorax TaxID=265477 RepID=UPI0004097FBA|nr:hypothetical protein [Desulfotruncus alcoholivorax]